MRKFLFACGMISLMLFTLTACGSEDPAEEISRALHIDVSAGEEISSSDAHVLYTIGINYFRCRRR